MRPSCTRHGTLRVFRAACGAADRLWQTQCGLSTMEDTNLLVKPVGRNVYYLTRPTFTATAVALRCALRAPVDRLLAVLNDGRHPNRSSSITRARLTASKRLVAST